MRIKFSIPQVLSVLFAMIAVTVDRRAACCAARGRPASALGADPRPSSQYVLIFLAVTFTWLMGLMGYVRSGLRQHWHVYGVIRDNSPDAFTPTLGFATRVVSVTVLHLLRAHRLRVLARQPGGQEVAPRRRGDGLHADARAVA